MVTDMNKILKHDLICELSESQLGQLRDPCGLRAFVSEPAVKSAQMTESCWFR